MLALLAATLLLTGCVTPRMVAQERQFPRNRAFVPGKLEELESGEAYSFAEFDAGGSQGIYVLRLRPDAALRKRYHREHDMTMFVVSGKAIVVVEETRYFVTPGSAVLLPKLTAYTVKPHETDEEFVALLVFSPPYDGMDTVLED